MPEEKNEKPGKACGTPRGKGGSEAPKSMIRAIGAGNERTVSLGRGQTKFGGLEPGRRGGPRRLDALGSVRKRSSDGQFKVSRLGPTNEYYSLPRGGKKESRAGHT